MRAVSLVACGFRNPLLSTWQEANSGKNKDEKDTELFLQGNLRIIRIYNVSWIQSTGFEAHLTPYLT